VCVPCIDRRSVDSHSPAQASFTFVLEVELCCIVHTVLYNVCKARDLLDRLASDNLPPCTWMQAKSSETTLSGEGIFGPQLLSLANIDRILCLTSRRRKTRYEHAYV
jgi:hypothetical protein